MKEQVRDTLIGAGGIGATEVVHVIGENLNLESTGNLIIQLIIGIVTLIKMFKKPKNGKVFKNS